MMDALLFLSPTLSPDPPAASYIIVAASAQNGRDVLKGAPSPPKKYGYSPGPPPPPPPTL